MKHLKYYFGLFTALLLAACSNNEVEVNPHAGEVIEIDARVNDYTPILTKAFDNGELQNSSFRNGSKIRLFVDYDLASSAVMTYSSSTSKFSYDSTPLTFPPFPVKLWAYHPEKDCKNIDDYFDTGSFNVATDQSTESNYRKSDLMWAVAENVSSNPVELNFKHALSKVFVKLNGFSNSYTLTTKMKQLYTAAKVAPSGSSFSFSSFYEKADITVRTSFHNNYPQVACVVIPQTVAEGTALIEISDGNETVTYNAPSGGIEFKSGHVYTFNLTYSGDRILDGTETVTVTDWNSDDGGGVTHVYNGNFN